MVTSGFPLTRIRTALVPARSNRLTYYSMDNATNDVTTGQMRIRSSTATTIGRNQVTLQREHRVSKAKNVGLRELRGFCQSVMQVLCDFFCVAFQKAREDNKGSEIAECESFEH